MKKTNLEVSNTMALLMKSKNLEYDRDVAIVLSRDALQYGDEGWGNANMAPFGVGYQRFIQTDSLLEASFRC